MHIYETLKPKSLHNDYFVITSGTGNRLSGPTSDDKVGIMNDDNAGVLMYIHFRNGMDPCWLISPTYVI